MLKKLGLTLAIAGIALVPNVSFANNQAKITVVKQAYSTELASLGGNYPSKYFDASFKRAISQHGEECDWHAWYNGQDHSFTVKQMKFSVLPNGRVRASYRNFGEAGFTDFSLIKSGNSYKISDMHLNGSGSYKVCR